MAAVNTLGGIVGSILAGFVLLPLLGMQRSILVLSGTSIVIGTLAWLWCDRQQQLIKVPYTLVFVCLVWLAIPLLLRTTLSDDYVNWGEKIVSIREGKTATMAVVLDRGVKQLKIDGWWQGEDRKNHPSRPTCPCCYDRTPTRCLSSASVPVKPQSFSDVRPPDCGMR